MNILHIDSSALGGHSVSRQLSLAVVETLTRTNPGTRLVYRDVAAHPLSHWAPVADAADPVNVHYAHADSFGLQRSSIQTTAAPAASAPPPG